MSYSENATDDDLIREFIEFYGQENLPNPDQYPRQIEFLIKSFQHYKRMRTTENEN